MKNTLDLFYNEVKDRPFQIHWACEFGCVNPYKLYRTLINMRSIPVNGYVLVPSDMKDHYFMVKTE